jgi:hypothetical protein
VNDALGTRFEQALAYAHTIHAAQRRKGGDTPYVAHLLAVAALVIEDAAAASQLSEDEVIAALLHDAPEDQGGEERLADIRGRFGDRVADIVAACSDTFETPKPPWRERKQAYLDHLAETPDAGVLRVSLADKVHNARAVLADYRVLGDDLWARFNRDADTLWYYRSLVAVFSERAPGPLANVLALAVAELDAAVAANGEDLIVVHADWGMAPGKRWIARARGSHGRWLIDAVHRWGTKGAPLERLGLSSDEKRRILIGVDFPIGLPKAYAQRAGISSFPDALPRFGGPGWERFYEVARTREEIAIDRPFYPHAPGGRRQQHLTDELNLPIADLRRACERRTATRPAACALFWTLGANQVGKGAIAGWQELVGPLVRDQDAAIWPFDGNLEELVRRPLTIAETYPAEYYGPIGCAKPGSKRVQEDRKQRGVALLDYAAGLKATLAPEVEALIADGFGPSGDGEDPFDAVVGLLGMLTALRDGSEAPTDPGVRTVEGWILGQAPPA